MQMETLVEDPNGSGVVNPPSGDGGASSPGGSTGAGQDGSSSASRSTPPPVSVSAAVAAHVRANGTVVFTSPAQVKHVVASGSSTTQAIAVPQPGGAVSIVHVSIPNQPVHVQSVIQPGPNQQSVIQAAGGAALQSLSKNVILLNKVTSQGSVIHSTDGDTGVHPVQLISAKPESDGETVTSIITADDESKKRREILARRPSYRKILNDLSSTETQGAVAGITGGSESKEDTGGTDTSSQEDSGASNGANTITVASAQYHTATGLLKVVPASAIQLAAATQDGGLQSLQTLTMTNAGTGATGAIVQYAQGQDGQFFVPELMHTTASVIQNGGQIQADDWTNVTVSAADLQAYQIRTAGGTTTTGIPQGVVVAPTTNLQTQQQLAEEASRKRELRLLKNREAAKECRRKKKEYIKCLENRVAVLENQNKALIEELKSLKELYCQKTD